MKNLKTRARAIARHGALDVISVRYRPQTLLAAEHTRPRVHFPYFHSIPKGEEDSFRTFVAQMAEYHTFISYGEAIERVKHGPIDKAYMAFSFDDGFESNVNAAHILEEFDTKGMFFVPSGFIGTKTVAEARDFYGFSEGVNEPAMTWGDLEHLLLRGHEIGNHTRGHRVLSWIDEDAMNEEIYQGAQELRTRLGHVEHFAWPRGRFFHFTENAARAVFSSGHSSCASAERGSHTVPHDSIDETLCIRRDHIMSNWPMRHATYFVANSSRKSSPMSNQWPKDWNVS